MKTLIIVNVNFLNTGLPLYIETWKNMEKPEVRQYRQKKTLNFEYKSLKNLKKPGFLNNF